MTGGEGAGEGTQGGISSASQAHEAQTSLSEKALLTEERAPAHSADEQARGVRNVVPSLLSLSQACAALERHKMLCIYAGIELRPEGAVLGRSGGLPGEALHMGPVRTVRSL